MKLNRLISTLSAAVMAVSGVCMPSFNALGSESNVVEAIYIPDFPQEVLDEFDIDWTGLGANRTVENMEYDMSACHNKFQYDGGYAMFSNQSYAKNLSYGADWYDCDSFTMYQSKEFPLSDHAEELDLRCEMFIFWQIKEEGELKTGPLLELSGGKAQLFIVERFSSAIDFSEYEKIGTYTSDGRNYDLYKSAESDSDGDVPVRYYSVDTDGLISSSESDSDMACNMTVNFSNHIAKLKELAEVDASLDRYGILTEGKKGIGHVFYEAKVNSSYITLPEEKLVCDESGSPISYDHNILKNFDGYRYSFRTSDSGWPIECLEDGRYIIPSNENSSFILPKGNGNFYAEVSEDITSGISAGKEYDGKTPLLDHNYQYNYKYSVSDDNVMVGATVWLLEPYVKLDFMEKSCFGDLSCTKYLGNIELGGEKYELYNYDGIDYDIYPLFEDKNSEFLFLHVDTPDVSDTSEKTTASSFPISALVKAAEVYGLEAGKLCRISLNVNSFSGGYNIEVTENNIIEDASFVEGTIFADAGNKYNVKLDPYEFSSNTSGYMYGYENGLFSIGAKEDRSSWFETGIVRPGGEIFVLNSNQNITVDYKFNNGFKDKYEIGYYLYGNVGYKNELIRIVESSSNYPIEKICVNSEIGISRQPSKPAPEFIKTYTAGGHEYDLYRDYCVFYGCFNTEYYETYVSIRKDQDNSSVLEGSLDMNEHLEQINVGLLGNISISGVYCEVNTILVSGTAEALKNDIRFEAKETPEVVPGDFNNDSRIDSMDIIAARRALVSKLSDEKESADEKFDLNHNGTFEIADVVILQSFVLGKIKAFPQAEQ